MGEGNNNNKFERIFEKLSPKDKIYSELEASKIIDNVIGFIPSSHSCDTATLISNLGAVIGKKDIQTCILDFKVFYPNIYKILDVEAKPKGQGLLTVLRSDKIDFTRELSKTKYDNLYILSPSPFDPIEEYFSFRLEDITRVINVLKEMFDIVLVDIPNCPPLEFCVGAVQNLNKGFMVWEERCESPLTTSKFLDFIGSLGISISKIANVIINNRMGFEFDKRIIKEMHLNLISEVPFVASALDSSLEGQVYMVDNDITDKRYKNSLESILNQILK